MYRPGARLAAAAHSETDQIITIDMSDLSVYANGHRHLFKDVRNTRSSLTRILPEAPPTHGRFKIVLVPGSLFLV
jgi:hypothetical protein